MPQGKEEIKKRVGELLARLQNKQDKKETAARSGSDGFADVYIARDRMGEKRGERLSHRPARIPEADEKRKLFYEMRRLSIGNWVSKNEYDKLGLSLFYRQAKFMEAFEDDYDGNAPFSMYYPCYQMMSYEQLRTYFTWRSGVRAGTVKKTSFSYVFVYLYEIINNIGVSGCADGFEKLVSLWSAYRDYEPKLDAYMEEWLRDYYVTNDFKATFGELTAEYAFLGPFYREYDSDSLFDFYTPMSSYKIQKSIFYKGHEAALRGCFGHVFRSLEQFMRDCGTSLDALLFYGNRGCAWQPFRKALYYPGAAPQWDRSVSLSDTERYWYENGRWYTSKNRIVRESGRLVIGYICKRIEQFYRRATKFKYKITADRSKLPMEEFERLLPEPAAFFERIDAAIAEYYRASQRKNVTVDAARLERIRENARLVQEKLTVEAEEAEAAPPSETTAVPAAAPVNPAPSAAAEGSGSAWERFAAALDETERAALALLLRDASARSLDDLCRKSGRMPEVLIDGINEKALELTGDGIVAFGEDAGVFAEYREDLERVILH